VYVDYKQTINTRAKNAQQMCRDRLYGLIHTYPKSYDEIVILCIGTDRATGDALGPLCGHLLSRLAAEQNFGAAIYGTLKNPVHAANLQTSMQKIQKKHPNPMIIAIDACLGKGYHIGSFIIRQTALYPGVAINNGLEAVGDISIIGIVNIAGGEALAILQSTRLGLVMEMAGVIAKGVFECMAKLQSNRLS